MNNSSAKDDSQRLEKIVAFLDGELPPQEEALVRRRLAEDSEFREEVQSMDRAWAALDELPAETVDDRFSQTTLELVVGEAQRELTARTARLPLQRRKQWLAKTLLAAAAAGLGWLVVQIVRENPNRVLMADLPVIHYSEVYSQFPDVDFLRGLRKELGDTPWITELPTTEMAERLSEYRQVTSSSAKSSWLVNLEIADRVALRGRYNHFLALSEQEQNRLRDLHKSILLADDHEEVVETLLEYESWLNTIPASQQFELRELPAEQRLAEIVQIQRREALDPRIELSTEEIRQLRRGLLAMRKRFTENLSSQQREWFESAGAGGRWFTIFRQFPQIREQWRAVIVESLSEEKAAQFKSLTTDQQNKQLVRWMREVALRESRDRATGKRRRLADISQEELEGFFAKELDAATQEQLLALPGERMEQQLRYLYLRGELPRDGDGPPEGNRFGPPTLDRFEPPDHGRRGPGPPREGQREGFGPPRRRGPADDRPGFGHPPRPDEVERLREPPPRPDEGFTP